MNIIIGRFSSNPMLWIETGFSRQPQYPELNLTIKDVN